MESPATTATAIGRNSGNTMASAASGYRAPLLRTGGEVGEHQEHGHEDRQGVEDGDRRPRPRAPEHLAQFDHDHRRPSTRSGLSPAAARTTSSSVGRSSDRPWTRTPAATSRALTSAGSAPRTITRSPSIDVA